MGRTNLNQNHGNEAKKLIAGSNSGTIKSLVAEVSDGAAREGGKNEWQTFKERYFHNIVQ